MRKLFVGLALASTTLAFAQTEGETTQTDKETKVLTYGVKAGAVASSMFHSRVLLTKEAIKVGFYAGVHAQMPIANSFKLNAELLYSQLGSKSDNKSMGTTKLDYITLPVTVQYDILKDLYVEAGPEFGYMISSSTTGTGRFSDDNLKKFNLGIGVGAGYFFTENIGVTAKYTAGVTDLEKNKPAGVKGAKNNVYQLGLAYKF